MKNKLIVFFTMVVVAGALIYTPAFAQINTSTSSLQSLIRALQQQIATLKARLDTLNQAQTAVGQAQSDITSTLKLIRNLKQGMSGEDVKLLQETLAADPAVYPDGFVTGYYGQLTAKAVKSFQKKHGISQTGYVGPLTMARLNRELDDHPIVAVRNGHGNNDDDNENGVKASTTHCAIVPPGHLIAPGWLRKQGGEKPIVPECQVLPPGIAAKLGLSTSTRDHDDEDNEHENAAPVISVLAAIGITSNSVHVVWTTNESSTSKVWYGTSTSVYTANVPNFTDANLVLSHDAALAGLLPSTTYYYVVGSSDASGKVSKSGQQSFATTAAPDITPPTISGVNATGTTATGTNTIWSTNEAASSKVWYSTSTPVVATSTTPTVSSSALVTSHNLIISGLATSTTYYYLVASADASNNTATSSEFSFTTLAQ